MPNLKLMLFAAILVGSIASAPCSAQTWIQMKGGAFSITPNMISEVKSTLRERIYKEGELPVEWGKYVLQFRAVRVSGLRAIEIHGSCQVSPAAKNLESEFYDVVDGGKCYFQVIYDPNSKRYSNVLFNGYA